MADATRAAAALQRAVSDIEVADFVALDLEFSGLFLDPVRGRQALTLDETYAKALESIPKFLPLQIGLCCAKYRAEGADGVWELRSHEFNLWPHDRRVFTADLQSLRFLRTHGFDFNAYFERAYPYARLPSTGKKLPTGHATRLLASLRDAQVPVVFHNGFLDVLHMYDKFIGPLPESRHAFAEAWTRTLPLLFDTRYMAQEGRNLLQHSGLSLEELHRHLGGRGRFEHLGPCEPAQAHGSAAKDAALTAEVFVGEVELWLRAEDRARKRRRKEEPSEALSAAEVRASGSSKRSRDDAGSRLFNSPHLLQSHETCQRFHNVLAIVGASPCSMSLRRTSETGQPLTRTDPEDRTPSPIR